MEKIIRTISPKQKSQQYRTVNTLSLPSLKNPKREKVDHLLSSDREKILQKLKQNYYPNDISYLKDRAIPELPAKSPSILPTDIVEIYNKVYSTQEPSLDFLNTSNKKRSKSPPQSLLEKLLSPQRNPIPEPSKTFTIGAPTGRQEAINLNSWYELMNSKYFSKFRELLSGKGHINRDKVVKAWKAVYLTAFNEIERQTQVHCFERGKLLAEVVKGFESLYEFTHTNFVLENQRLAENYAREISDARLESAKKLAHFQVKIEILEKEKFELRHNNGQCIIKIRELERLIDDYRRNEKSNLRGPKVSTQKYPNTFFEESPMVKEEMETVISVPETLTLEINKKITKLAEIKKKIISSREEVKNLETQIHDRKTDLASINFEIELRQNLVRPMAKYTPKALINLPTYKNKKKVEINTTYTQEDDSQNCSEFFKSLIQKPRERLLNKGKISQDHIFQSLGVIYQRSIIQTEIFNEIYDFQFLVYKQFVKLENSKKGEKILKNFICGCLKLSDFLRVSVFLRFLGLGPLINQRNYSTKTLQVYLSSLLFMDTLEIGLLIHKDTASPTQFYPLIRAQTTIKELASVFPINSKHSIEAFTLSNSIQDPKQINPQGLIELEKFLEKVSNEYEDIIGDISLNTQNLFQTVSKRQILNLDYFRLLISKVSREKVLSNEENIEKDLQELVEIKAAQGIEICQKFNLLSTEDIEGFLGNLASVSQSFAKNLLLSQYPSPIPSLYQNILDGINEIEVRFALVWWKILNNNQ